MSPIYESTGEQQHTSCFGIDPGLATTGYGLVVELSGQLRAPAWGAVRPPASAPLGERLDTLYQEILSVLRTHQPQAVALETLYAHRAHPYTAVLMSQARGVVVLAAKHAGVPVFDYGASEVKRALTGSGRASKEQIQKMVFALAGLSHQVASPDVTDALALAICHLNQKRIAGARGILRSRRRGRRAF